MQADVKETFVIDNDEKAQWAIDKIREAKANTERWRVHYDRAMRLIEESDNAMIEYMTCLLRDYFETVPHHETKTQKSYTLPSGVLVMKNQAPEFRRDGEKLLAWAKKSMPELVKTTESVNWDAIKKLCISGTATIKDTGEVVDGVEIIEREPLFSVTIK